MKDSLKDRMAETECQVPRSTAGAVHIMGAVLSLRPTMARAPSPHDGLIDILQRALTRPASLAPARLGAIERALARTDDRRQCELAVSAVAAVLYARPDLVDDALLDRLIDLLNARPVPPAVGRAVVKVFEFLAASPAAPRAWTRLSGMLRDQRLDGQTRTLLVPLLRDFVLWREDLVGLDGALAMAASPALAGHRPFLLDHVVERFVFTAPEAFSEERLDRIIGLFTQTPRWQYFLYALAERPRLAPELRARIARMIPDLFPHHAAAAAILKVRPFKLLVAVNARLAQGDEIIRLAPLLQALLDANPALVIRLVTQRAYLYDNPRVTPIPIEDQPTVRATLGERFDGVAEIFDPAPEFVLRPELHAAIQHFVGEQRPAFVVEADVAHHHFVYPRVRLSDCDIARSCGLDRRDVDSNYDACLRLIAELGLPQRAGEDPPLTPSLLAGVRSADAERTWADLVAKSKAGHSIVCRSVVLLNAFGGARPTKGFVEQHGDLLAAEIAALVDEGYLVVVLPNGTRWGGLKTIAAVLSRLRPKVRGCVRIAPDPAEPTEAVRLRLSERPTLDPADRVMRLFKYFATYADLVVTVEGWMAHLAYNLGRPFRLFLAAQSEAFAWHPHGRSRDQQLVTMLSPRSHAPYPASGLLREDDPAPLPGRPRKTVLGLALHGLGEAGGARAAVLLRRAVATPDYELRAVTIAAVGRIRPLGAVKSDLLAALGDREPLVQREAADALLAGGADCSRELGARYRQQLRAYSEIARQNWGVVWRLGPAALPALFRATESHHHVTRREARSMLRRMLPSYVPGLFPESRPTVECAQTR